MHADECQILRKDLTPAILVEGEGGDAGARALPKASPHGELAAVEVFIFPFS